MKKNFYLDRVLKINNLFHIQKLNFFMEKSIKKQLIQQIIDI